MQYNIFSSGFIGRKLISLSSTPSTNEYLKDQLSKSTPLPEGTVIMAVQQTAGKGQHGTRWHGESGKNLTFSVLLYPKMIPIEQQFTLTVAISLALVRYLEQALPADHHVAIKWPNDIYINGRKIAGILIENSFRGRQWNHAVIGIGLNINQTDFPESIQQATTSMALLTGQQVDLMQVLSELCTNIETSYQEIIAGNQQSLTQSYHQKLYRLGEQHNYLIDGVAVPAVLIGVSQQGKLQLDFNGHVVEFDLKELKFQ